VTAVALTVEDFVATLPAPRFVRVRDVENEWRVVGVLVVGREYDVAKRDGSTMRVRIERITARRPNGEVMAKFVSLHQLGDGLFAEWAAEDETMDWTEFHGDW
jgi:hypothetical protein